MKKASTLLIISLFALASCGTSGTPVITSSEAPTPVSESSSSAPQGDTHTVSFDSDGGTSVQSITVKHGEKASKPEDPTKEGYDFAGWIYNGEEWSFVGYVVTEDMTLKANWIPKRYRVNVSYNVNELSVDGGNTYYDYGSTCTLTATGESGYALGGWYEGDTVLSNESTYSFTVTKEINIIAKSKQGPRNISFSGSGNGEINITKGTGIAGEEMGITATPETGNHINTVVIQDVNKSTCYYNEQHSLTITMMGVSPSTINLFLWNYNGDTNGEWPGKEIEIIHGNHDYVVIDFYSINKNRSDSHKYTHFIISSGTKGNQKTADLEIANWKDCIDAELYKNNPGYYLRKYTRFSKYEKFTGNSFTFEMPDKDISILYSFLKDNPLA